MKKLSTIAIMAISLVSGIVYAFDPGFQDVEYVSPSILQNRIANAKAVQAWHTLKPISPYYERKSDLADLAMGAAGRDDLHSMLEQQEAQRFGTSSYWDQAPNYFETFPIDRSKAVTEGQYHQPYYQRIYRQSRRPSYIYNEPIVAVEGINTYSPSTKATGWRSWLSKWFR